LTALWSLCSTVGMGNVLDTHRQQQVVALGRLGWPLRRIERETGVRRETVSTYLKAAGLAVRGRGRPGEAPAKAAIAGGVSTDLPAKPAITPAGVSTDSPPTRAPQAVQLTASCSVSSLQ